MAEAAGGGPSLPEDLIFCDILTRLPAKPVLRCRAVCRSWRRRLTTDAKFLLAHHRRQPSLPLVTEGSRTTEERRIDVLDHRTGERRLVARTTGGTGGAEGDLRVLASCDGLLVLRANGGIHICNPATRQRAPLTLLQGATEITALYHHRPSGSYRVLCCFDRAEGNDHAVCHVHTVGSRELRCVGEPPGAWASEDKARAIQMVAYFRPHVVANGRVYWQPVMLDEGNAKVNNMLAFDTMAESFQQLLSPVEGSFQDFELFQTNSGALELYHYRGCGTTDLWELQDHESWSWSKKHQIKFAGLVHSLLPVLDPEGDVLGLSDRGRSQGIQWQHLQHISGANGSLLARYEWSANLRLSRHWFKESLVHHDFFSMEGNAGAVDEKPLFDGLSTVELVRDDNYEPSHNEKQRY